MTQNEYDKWYRELNEAQKEATDEFFAWKEKASKGKDCYADIGITRINGKAEVALREGEYISPFRGFQMSLKQNGRILSSCNWRCEDGVEKFPLLFSTKTFKSGKIAAGIFVRDGAMQSPIILGCPDDFEPDAFYEVFVHAWGAEMGYLWEGDGKIQGLTRIDYLLSGNLGETQNPIENWSSRCTSRRPLRRKPTMSNMYGKDKFHDRQKAVLQKSAQKIENDSGWSQDNFLRGYAEEILPASGAELSFGELCAIGEQVEQEAAFSAKEAMRNKIKARRDAERYKSTGTDSEQRTPNPFEDSSAIATESPKNEDTLNTMRKHADAQPTKSAGIKTSKKQSLVETTRELKKYIHIISCGGVLYYHNEYYYTQLDSKQLIKLYRQNVDYELNNESSLRGYKDLYDCLVTDPQIECSEPEDEPIYAPLENGILDLMEWKLYPHSPDQITFTCIKAKYDPQAKCQIFEEYLQRVTGGDSLLSERVWMAIGYLLIYPARGKFFIFMKGIGNSGKSVLGSFIRRLYPKESISSIRLKQMKNEFGMSSLANAVINFDMDRRRKKLIRSAGSETYWAHVLWQRHGLRPEEFDRMSRRQKLFYIASEEEESARPCRRDTMKLVPIRR